MRTTPPSACAPTISPTATAFGSLVFDDLENDFPVRAGGGGIQDGADRLRRPTLLPDDPAQVLLRDFELEHGSRLTLGLLHLDRVGMVDQVLGEKQHQFLHGNRSSSNRA